MKNSIISSVYVVSGQPHILLASEKSKSWRSLYDSYGEIRKEIARQEADVILYMSTQWLSVIGYMFQGDPAPEWTHVDHNFHDLGSIKYKFKIDADFANAYAKEVGNLGFTTKVVNYRGFPIDTGTIVAQKLLNPDNKIPAAIVSCGLYAEKEETTQIGQAAAWALKNSGKKAIVVLVSNLSNRFEIKEIDPTKDQISSLKDDEWNQKILEIFSRGALEDVSQVAREFGRQANADMGFKGVWWLNGLCGETNDFTGKVFDYQPVWGTGAALIGLYPTAEIQPKPWESAVSEEGSQADMVKNIADRQTLTPGILVTTHVPQKPAIPIKSSFQSDAVESSRSPEPVGAYPHARRFGDLLFLSGMGPRVRGSKTIPGVTTNAQGEVIDHDIKIQTLSVIENLKTVLEDAGSSMEKVIDVQVFLTHMQRDFKGFNEVYAQTLGKIGPTRTTVEVKSLPTPIAVEFKVIAQA
jgi:2-aminophenol/2-amino-5-chlorophenol 1,6-dioxygenase alpha subunit